MAVAPRLWVPMQVQSLVFGKPGTAAFLDLAPRYEELGDRQTAPLGRRLRPNLDRTTPRPGFLPRGIHLHWMLPAAFAHLRPGDGGQPPRVPNRWIVTRLWLDAGKLRLRAWVVESDTVSDDGAVPWLDSRLDPTLLIGLTRDLAGWTEPGTAMPEFSGFAPGDLGFAASYAACRGVFGFHDPCRDLKANTVCSYLVTGWFSDPAADPLAAGGAEVLERLRWALAAPSDARPAATTCYAIAPGIVWTPDAECTTAGQPNVAVAVGSSFAEAVAALARGNGSPADRDGLVSLQQLAVLDARRPTAADLTPDFFRVLGRMLGARARMHERGFAAEDGGTLWEITARERSPGQTDADRAPELRLPPDLAGALADLNQFQADHDDVGRRLADARSRLFLAWSQLQHWTIRATGAATPAQAAALRAEVAARSADVTAAAARLDGLASQRGGQEDQVRDRLRAKDAEGLVLVSRPMPRFWRPADPFVLTAGLTVPMLQGGASPLVCRTSDQVVPGLAGKWPVDRAVLRDHLAPLLAAADLPPGNQGVPPDWTDLLLDTILADASLARVLALAALGRSVTDPSEDQIARARDAIAAAQAPVRAAADALARGLPDGGAPLPLGLEGGALRSFLSAIWSSGAPPRPVHLVWEANWHPHGADGWEVPADDVDHHWSGPAPVAEARSLDGFVPLATGLERGLAPTRERFPEPGLAFALAGLDRLAGQTLAGLTAAFATRDSGAQLQPLARSRSGLSLDPVAALVADDHVAGPLTGDGDSSPFAPLRGGRIDLVRLWIIDSFGRVQRLIDPAGPAAPPAVARSLSGGSAGAILLPPRLVQPARLRLTWQSARHDDTESRGDLATSPVCGFILHNRLDRNLLVYGARGPGSPDTLLGAVQPVRLAHGQEVARWSTLPVRPLADDAAPRDPARLTAADIPNPHLRGFVNGLLARFGGAAGTGFEAFRSLLADHEDRADLSRDQGLQAMLVGRPLALVRAALRLELAAAPVADQNWRTILGLHPAQPWVRGRTFPVRIGDRRLGPEGLVGLFLDGAADPYLTMGLRSDRSYPDSITGHPYFASADLTVPCDPEAAPPSFTLLLDPRCPVNLVSGILPASTAQLPEGLVDAGLGGLEIPFLVAPVLGERAPSKGRTMPLPTGSQDEWRWVGFADRAAPPVEEPVSGDTAAAGALEATKALHEGWLRYCPPKRGKP